jgi:hypothetical protein
MSFYVTTALMLLIAKIQIQSLFLTTRLFTDAQPWFRVRDLLLYISTRVHNIVQARLGNHVHAHRSSNEGLCMQMGKVPPSPITLKARYDPRLVLMLARETQQGKRTGRHTSSLFK